MELEELAVLEALDLLDLMETVPGMDLEAAMEMAMEEEMDVEVAVDEEEVDVLVELEVWEVLVVLEALDLQVLMETVPGMDLELVTEIMEDREGEMVGTRKARNKMEQDSMFWSKKSLILKINQLEIQ